MGETGENEDSTFYTEIKVCVKGTDSKACRDPSIKCRIVQYLQQWVARLRSQEFRAKVRGSQWRLHLRRTNLYWSPWEAGDIRQRNQQWGSNAMDQRRNDIQLKHDKQLWIPTPDKGLGTRGSKINRITCCFIESGVQLKRKIQGQFS